MKFTGTKLSNGEDIAFKEPTDNVWQAAALRAAAEKRPTTR